MRTRLNGHPPRRTIAVIGTGYLGTANAIGFAYLGYHVAGYDILAERIRELAAGITPYHEPGIKERLRTQLAEGRLRFTTDLAKAVVPAEIVVLALPTPVHDDGSSDLSALDAAVASLQAFDLRAKLVVLRSTVPPGTTRSIEARLPDARVVFSPEFLREGSAVDDFLRPSRTVIGATDYDAARAYAEIAEALDCPVFFTSPAEAETIKVFSNAFLATKISFANEVANFCNAIDADAPLVLAAMAADPRIGPSCFAPGIGFGGPCLSKDVRSLQASAREAGAASEILAATLRVNEAQPHRVVTILEDECGGSLDGATIGVWGIAFKAGTDDVRHSLAVRIINQILSRGASVRAYDPAVAPAAYPPRCEIATSAVEALEADALLLLTDWPEFAEVDPALAATFLRRKVVVDGRNALPHRAYAAAGLRYRGIGRRETPAEVDEYIPAR